MAESFRISSEIVHETVEGEVIAIDLANGSYYSLAGSGPVIWELLGAGAGEAELRDAVAARFGVDPAAIGAEVGAFLAELKENGLVVPAEGEAAAAPAAAGAQAAGAYEAPKLERYTDMKDYFLLDPIHEVDTAGWPRPAA